MSHYPPEKIAFRMRTPTWCRTRADQIGPACAELIGGLLQVNALFRLRAAQGVLGLADRHGPDRLEAACAKAIAAGDPSYRTVKGILAAGTETQPTQRPTGDGGAAAHLHGPTQLFRTVIPCPPARARSSWTPPRRASTTPTTATVRRPRHDPPARAAIGLPLPRPADDHDPRFTTGWCSTSPTCCASTAIHVRTTPTGRPDAGPVPLHPPAPQQDPNQ